jgi:predicted DNA-binding protein (MmcQ/YjbR family)
MSPAELDAACRALPGVTMVIQWGADAVYKVCDRIFAITGPTGGVSFKATDIAYEALTDSGRARPAPYLARAKWVYFDHLADLDADEVRGWLATAHALVAAKLTRAERTEIGL